jgi:phosphatidate cytidylyltransferase
MLRHRLQSGILLGGALLAAVFFLPAPAVLAVLLIIGFLGLLEFYALLDARGILHFKVVGVAGGLLLIGGTWWALRGTWMYRTEVEGFLLFAVTAGVLLRQISDKHAQRPWETMAGTLMGVLYVAFLFTFIVKLLTAWGDLEGRFLVLYLVAVVKLTDIGAYSVGCAIGRHKLIPRISPAKTWEGVAGGVLTGLGGSLLCWKLGHGHLGSFSLSLTDALVLGLILPVAGVIGDLVESLLKRASGVKDSGSMILGMGGILDVIDSLLLAAPLLYVYARVFLAPL